MSDDCLLFEVKDRVALLTLNRPEVRNAFNPELLVNLDRAWNRVRDDEGIRVAVITGSGEAFSAGMDIGSMVPLLNGARKAGDEWDRAILTDQQLGYRAILRNFDTRKPVVAAINGFAIAAGMELLMGCDLRVSARSASFALTEAKLGLFPGGGSTVRLPNQIPYVRAMELLLTGDRSSAQDMLEYGFLNYVVNDEDVLDKAFEIAGRIAANGPVAVRAIRQSVREAIGMSELNALERERELAAPVYRTEDAREGPRAFTEKRTPEFRGR
jgi:enoyl-CoA hydratase